MNQMIYDFWNTWLVTLSFKINVLKLKYTKFINLIPPEALHCMVSQHWICTHYFQFHVTGIEKLFCLNDYFSSCAGTFMKSTFVSLEYPRIRYVIPVFYKKILWNTCSASGGIKLVNFVHFTFLNIKSD